MDIELDDELTVLVKYLGYKHGEEPEDIVSRALDLLKMTDSHLSIGRRLAFVNDDGDVVALIHNVFRPK